MSKRVRSAGFSRALIQPSLAILGLVCVGGTAAFALTMTSFSGAEVEIPSVTPLAVEVEREAPVVFGPMPAPEFNVVADAPDAAQTTDSQVEVANEGLSLEAPPPEVRVIDATGAIEKPLVVETPAALEVASIDPEPASVQQVPKMEPLAQATQTLIEMAPVAVYRPDERFNSANPQATVPPVPLGRDKRPILQVTPAAVAAIVPARSVSLDPLLSDAADGTWPRRLDQVNARQNLVEFATAHNHSSNVFVMDVKIEGWGLERLFTPPANVGE